ncbi:MAG: ABC transporter substrate-binding protein [Bacteroidales bacterium]|nr:ABC transporter substrate-binding protein [Bacteroidales bacterium]
MRNLFFFLLVVFIIACSRNKNDNKKGANYFFYNEISRIKSLDPAQARDLPHMWIVHQMFNTLLEFDDSLHLICSLAKSWEVDSTRKVYTFHLRQDVYFHTTHFFREKLKCTAYDVKFTFNRLADPSTASPGRWITDPIDTTSEGKLRIEVKNDSTITFYLKKSFFPFLYYLTLPYASIVPEAYIKKIGKDFSLYPIGTGPFKLRVWKPDQILILQKNNEYFEKDTFGHNLPYLDGVCVRFIQDKQVAFMEFMRGGFDFISGFDPILNFILFDEKGNLKSRYRSKWMVQRFPFLNVEYIGMNITKPPFDRWQVRKAIDLAIDKSKLVFYVRKNTGFPAYSGFVPPALLQAQSLKENYNPEKSKELLKEVGYDEQNPFPEITLHTTSNYLELAEFVQNELRKINITLKIEVLPSATLREMMYGGKTSFFRASWVADYPDAGTFLSLFYSANKTPYGPNYTFFSNKTYDSLYEISLTTFNDSVREKIYIQLNQILVKEVPVVPLYYDEAIRLVSLRIEGLKWNIFNMLKLKNVKKKD